MPRRLSPLKRDNDYYLQFVLTLDDPRIEMNDKDIDFLESLLTYYPDPLSPKQITWITDMAWRYLGEAI